MPSCNISFHNWGLPRTREWKSFRQRVSEEEEKDGVTFTVSCPLHRCLSPASQRENTRSVWSGEDATISFLWVSQFSLLISQDLQNTLLLTSFPSFLPLITPSFDAPSLFLSLSRPFLCCIHPSVVIPAVVWSATKVINQVGVFCSEVICEYQTLGTNRMWSSAFRHL